ncbi:PREDICTED: uncharacterized protein LOC109298670 isoform X3 [Gavialis gangeticus]|uniref:uncharacterized protein LOC109298670 isoform X3 n=1 Tax=Gavialis gangeticus TaxID=94835 RepID=UPI00092E9A95|nr:PREDICTED: uncharacterized protein LOC109298670 isoform X3 [Gavialis gangeticus]
MLVGCRIATDRRGNDVIGYRLFLVVLADNYSCVPRVSWQAQPTLGPSKQREGEEALGNDHRSLHSATKGSLLTPAAAMAMLYMQQRYDFDDFLLSNNDVMLRSIAEDLRKCLPIEGMLNSEHLAIQRMHQHPEPMIHVDAFLYDDDFVDSLCEEGKMSRNYCVACGSHKTAPLVQGCLYSSAFQLYGVEMNADFCHLQEMMITKYHFTDRVKVIHADICTQALLLQNADVVVMNNVFEYFLDSLEQARAWEFISQNVRKKGLLLVTVPSLEESLSNLQMNIQLSQWVEEVQLDYDVYVEKDIDREALQQIHLYKIL